MSADITHYVFVFCLCDSNVAPSCKAWRCLPQKWTRDPEESGSTPFPAAHPGHGLQELEAAEPGY